jgi:hypothetical protein
MLATKFSKLDGPVGNQDWEIIFQLFIAISIVIHILILQYQQQKSSQCSPHRHQPSKLEIK